MKLYGFIVFVETCDSGEVVWSSNVVGVSRAVRGNWKVASISIDGKCVDRWGIDINSFSHAAFANQKKSKSQFGNTFHINGKLICARSSKSTIT